MSKSSGQDTEPQTVPDGCSIGVWVFFKVAPCLLASATGVYALNGWMPVCVGKHSEWAIRLEKRYINAVHNDKVIMQYPAQLIKNKFQLIKWLLTRFCSVKLRLFVVPAVSFSWLVIQPRQTERKATSVNKQRIRQNATTSQIKDCKGQRWREREEMEVHLLISCIHYVWITIHAVQSWRLDLLPCVLKKVQPWNDMVIYVAHYKYHPQCCVARLSECNPTE